MDATDVQIAGIVAVAIALLWLATQRLHNGKLAAAVLAVAAGVAVGFASVDVPVTGTCQDIKAQAKDAAAGQVAGAPGLAQDVSSPVPLELAPDSDTTVDFRQRRQVRRPSVFLQRVRASDEEAPAAAAGPVGTPAKAAAAPAPTLPMPGSRLNVTPVDFERDGGDYELDPNHIWAEAVVRSNRDGVRLVLCIDPEDVPPGVYQGSVVFDDSRVTAGSVQWTVTLQYEKWWVAAFGALLVALAAFFYSYSTTGNSAGFGEYARDNVIGIAAGLATATVAFFGAYWGSTHWGGDPGDWLKGAGAVFASFTTGFLAQRMRSPRLRGPTGDDSVEVAGPDAGRAAGAEEADVVRGGP